MHSCSVVSMTVYSYYDKRLMPRATNISTANLTALIGCFMSLLRAYIRNYGWGVDNYVKASPTDFDSVPDRDEILRPDGFAPYNIGIHDLDCHL